MPFWWPLGADMMPELVLLFWQEFRPVCYEPRENHAYGGQSTLHDKHLTKASM